MSQELLTLLPLLRELALERIDIETLQRVENNAVLLEILVEVEVSTIQESKVLVELRTFAVKLCARVDFAVVAVVLPRAFGFGSKSQFGVLALESSRSFDLRVLARGREQCRFRKTLAGMPLTSHWDVLGIRVAKSAVDAVNVATRGFQARFSRRGWLDDVLQEEIVRGKSLHPTDWAEGNVHVVPGNRSQHET